MQAGGSFLIEHACKYLANHLHLCFSHHPPPLTSANGAAVDSSYIQVAGRLRLLTPCFTRSKHQTMMATETTCTFRDLIEYASKNFPEAYALIPNPNSYLFETRTVHFGSEHPIMVHAVVLATAADQAEPSHKLLAAFSAGAHVGFIYGSGHCTLTERELYEARDLDIGRLREPHGYLDVSQSGSNSDMAEQFAMLSMLVQYSLLLTAKIQHSFN